MQSRVIYLWRSDRGLECLSSDGFAIQALREQPCAAETGVFLVQEQDRTCMFQLSGCGACHILQVMEVEWAGQTGSVDEAPYKCCLLCTFYPDDYLDWGNMSPLIQVLKHLQYGVQEHWMGHCLWEAC